MLAATQPLFRNSSVESLHSTRVLQNTRADCGRSSSSQFASSPIRFALGASKNNSSTELGEISADPWLGVASVTTIFETFFFIFAFTAGKMVLGTLGLWTIAVANLLAAAGMSFYLLRRHPDALRKMDRIWTDQE